MLVFNSTAERLCNNPDTSVINNCKLFLKLIICKTCKVIRHKRVNMLLERSDSLHKGTLEVVADTHYLSGSLHLSGKCTLCCEELVERKSWNLDYTVIKHWLKACVCLLCDSVLDLIEVIAECNLGCNLGDRISCSL